MLCKTLEHLDASVYSRTPKRGSLHAYAANYNGGICSVSVYRQVRQWTLSCRKVVDVNKVPEPWASRMIERGYTDRRSAASVEPSLTALSEQTGIHVTTITATITGARRPSMRTVAALAAALGDDVSEWLRGGRLRDWTPPPEATLLTHRQRKALDELIRSMTSEQGGEGHDRPPATNPPAPGPADQPGKRHLKTVEREYPTDIKEASRRDEE